MTFEMGSSKVFCIGFQKSGTSTLGYALEILGYRVKGFSPELLEAVENKDWDTLDKTISQYSAFQDNPWPILFKELDEKYPGSKFILTERDPEGWYNSVLNHFQGEMTLMRRHIYGHGDPVDRKKEYIDRFNSHIQSVKAHFKDRSDDLLIMNLKNGDGWDELCAFLDKSRPKGEFPHKNRKEVRTWWGRLLTKIKQKFNIDFNF